jgi:hypothetical protein
MQRRILGLLAAAPFMLSACNGGLPKAESDWCLAHGEAVLGNIDASHVNNGDVLDVIIAKYNSSSMQQWATDDPDGFNKACDTTYNKNH